MKEGYKRVILLELDKHKTHKQTANTLTNWVIRLLELERQRYADRLDADVMLKVSEILDNKRSNNV